MTEFIAVDGEGKTHGNAHDYYLLCASNGEYIESSNRLRTIDIFRFLERLGQSGAVLVGFGLGYDYTKWLEDLPECVLAILQGKRHATVAYNGEQFRLQLIPGKWLQINDTKIFDVFSFFQKSFIRTLLDWRIASKEQLGYVAEMKGKRGSFADIDDDKIRIYCMAECRYLVRLMQRLEASQAPLDIALSSWHGPGAIANELLKKHNIRQQIGRRGFERIPRWNRVFRTAYFGGRFEVAWYGEFNGPLYDYDINSAYPYAIAQLPSLKGARWRRTKDYRDDVPGLYHIRWKRVLPSRQGKAQYFRYGPFPFRMDDGTILYPMHGEGWYWHHEIAAAMAMKHVQIKVLEGRYLDAPDTTPVFDWVPELYELRRVLKAQDNIAHISMKLAYNSIYGKFAEKMREDGTLPRWQCYAWAGMITSHCRAQLLRAISQNEEAIIGVATDGILSTQPLDLPISGDLGDWELHTYDSAFVVQNGIMRLEADGEIYTKSRGNTADELDWEKLQKLWRKHGFAAKLSYETTRFMNVGASLMRSNPREVYGTWRTEKRELSLRLENRQMDPYFNIRAHKSANPHTLKTFGYADEKTMRNRISAPYRQAYEIAESEE